MQKENKKKKSTKWDIISGSADQILEKLNSYETDYEITIKDYRLDGDFYNALLYLERRRSHDEVPEVESVLRTLAEMKLPKEED